MTNKQEKSPAVSEILTLSQAETFLEAKREDLNKKSNEVLIFIDEGHKAEDIRKLQEVLHNDEQLLISLRNSLDLMKKNDPALSQDPRWTISSDSCEKLISEARIFDARLDKKRKESAAVEEKKAFNLLSFFSLSILFPSAAGVLTKLFRPGDDDAAKAAAVSVATIGIGYHFRENIRELWEKAADVATGRIIRGFIALQSADIATTKRMKKAKEVFCKHAALATQQIAKKPKAVVRKIINKIKRNDSKPS